MVAVEVLCKAQVESRSAREEYQLIRPVGSGFCEVAGARGASSAMVECWFGSFTVAQDTHVVGGAKLGDGVAQAAADAGPAARYVPRTILDHITTAAQLFALTLRCACLEGLQQAAPIQLSAAMKPYLQGRARMPAFSSLVRLTQHPAHVPATVGLRWFNSSGCHMKGNSRAMEKFGNTPSLSKMQENAQREFWQSGSMLIPGTFIPLPLSQYPRNPRDFLAYQWQRTKYWAVSTLQFLVFKWKSKPSWRTSAQWNSKKRQITPTAKALHREMLEAFAAGDKATLQRICTRQFAAQLGAAIDKRNPREKTTFELIQYNKPLFYPRLKSHLLLAGYTPDKDVVLEQAVVAIASTQKASKQDLSKGTMVPGSLRLQEKVEYVVLTRQGYESTYEVGPWRIWGTTSATTIEGWNEYMEIQNKEQAARSGYNKRLSR
ncbi:hypothetical protein HJFPF1_05132 [Paramyrothecium foliicola]|nr:hypothetical protein HJFPF1_05132 [Paramyrothecium foliicola]